MLSNSLGDPHSAAGVTSPTSDDNLLRRVYCVLGMPIDVVGMSSVLLEIETAASYKRPLFIFTANLNFLANSQSDPDFRESLLQNDLCPVDGIPIVWIARMVGVPIKSRIAGSDIFDSPKVEYDSVKPLKVFLFGAAEGVAARASEALNYQPNGLHCVGSLYPGFVSVDNMSCNDVIETINSSNADFLVVWLYPKKGQSWLWRNHSRLTVPVRAHLGAVINFQTNVIRRAPLFVRKCGFEWLWRIKEESYPWRRCWNDGVVFLRLIFTRVLLLTIRAWWLRVKCARNGPGLIVAQAQGQDSITISLCGPATAKYVEKIATALRIASAMRKQIAIDFSKTCAIDARFLGLLLMLRKQLKVSGEAFVCTDLSDELKRIFHLNGLEFLPAECPDCC
jgi:N-acetylglucosaminyldiphosphoundecaprenol N-acetyl-beta-D-mannosaminyltransferase